MPMFGGRNKRRHSTQLCRVSACSRAGSRGRSGRRPPAPLRHNGQAPPQGRRVQGVYGCSGLHLVEEQHGASRFQDLDKVADTCPNRVGFRRNVRGVTEYIVLPESFRAEVIKGFSPRRAAAVLRNAGWLHLSDDKNTIKRELPGMGRVRAYVLVLPDESGNDDESS